MKKRMRVIECVVVLVIFAVCCVNSMAATYTAHGTEDASVAVIPATGTYGDWNGFPNDGTIDAGADTGGVVYWAWFKYALPTFGADEVIDTASLTFVPVAGLNNAGTTNMGIYYCSENSWSEGTITYNSAPWSGVDSSPIAQLIPSIWNYNTVDITSALVGMSGGQNVTFVMTTMNQSVAAEWYIQTSEGGYPPYLSINATVVPEPATMALLVMGCFGLLRRNRTV
ncbi:MAG: hypothetical protein A2Y12_05635 [Planctomycetes bacterium GWF2_42_9]|nr:MAG: hypothetical protein A2Y12_05635 [Planctomycetes bacterium GWF2_42_9]